MKIDYIKLMLVILISLGESRKLNAQTLDSLLKFIVTVDSISTFGKLPVVEHQNKEMTTPYCDRKIYFTLRVINQSNRKLQLVRNSIVLDFRAELFDIEIERFDSITKSYISTGDNLSNPALGVDYHNLYINGNDTLVYRLVHNYWTRINEENRVRVVLNVSNGELSMYKIFSDWINIKWEGIQLLE